MTENGLKLDGDPARQMIMAAIREAIDAQDDPGTQERLSLALVNGDFSARRCEHPKGIVVAVDGADLVEIHNDAMLVPITDGERPN